jgi:hypothetical protein
MLLSGKADKMSRNMGLCLSVLFARVDVAQLSAAA